MTERIGWWPKDQTWFPMRDRMPMKTADELEAIIEMMSMAAESREALKRQVRAGNPGARFIVYGWAVRDKVPGFTPYKRPSGRR